MTARWSAVANVVVLGTVASGVAGCGGGEATALEAGAAVPRLHAAGASAAVVPHGPPASPPVGEAAPADATVSGAPAARAQVAKDPVAREAAMHTGPRAAPGPPPPVVRAPPAPVQRNGADPGGPPAGDEEGRAPRAVRVPLRGNRRPSPAPPAIAPERRPVAPGATTRFAVGVAVLGAGLGLPVAVPAGRPLLLTVASADGRRHRVVVGTSPRIRFTVDPRGPRSIAVPALRPGSFPVRVDGRPGPSRLDVLRLTGTS